jgi:predicted RNase H-like HicB family nuclease
MVVVEERHESLERNRDPSDALLVVNVPDLPRQHTHGRAYCEAVWQAQEAIEGRSKAY